MRVDAEIDFHTFSRAQMVGWLEDKWATRKWHGLRRIRIIHGKGDVLHAALREWCDHKGIPWAAESGNPGATIIRPANRDPERQAAVTANKPLKHIKRQVVPSPPPKPIPPPDPADSDMFEQAIAEIEEFDARGLRRSKHA